MNKFERIAGTLILASATSGCGSSQVENLQTVDCDNGPRTAEIELTVQPGKSIKLGSKNFGDIIGAEQSVLDVTSDGDGKFTFNIRGGIRDFSIDPKSPFIERLGPVGINQDGSIIFNSNNVDITLSGTATEDGLTNFKIKTECT